MYHALTQFRAASRRSWSALSFLQPRRIIGAPTACSFISLIHLNAKTTRRSDSQVTANIEKHLLYRHDMYGPVQLGWYQSIPWKHGFVGIQPALREGTLLVPVYPELWASSRPLHSSQSFREPPRTFRNTMSGRSKVPRCKQSSQLWKSRGCASAGRDWSSYD